MAIKLDILKNRKNTDIYRNFTYADVRLDLQLNAFVPNKPVGVNTNPQDFKLDYDSDAIYNSIRNIFNTKKGQKILNPEFGLDIEQYLFDNISKENADIIGNTIYEDLPVHEPRAKVDSVDVTARPDDNEYKIVISITIPSLNNQRGAVDGILTRQGFEY